MRKRFLVLLSISALLLTVAAVPQTLFAKYTLKIINHTLVGVKFTLENIDPDEPNYKFTASANAVTRKTIKEGDYEITYYACKNTVDWKGNTVKVDADPFTMDQDITIELQPCKGQPVETKLVIYSHLEDALTIDTISLNEEDIANKDYSLKVENGKNRYKNIWSGDYIYTYEACDQTFSGEFNITKTGDTVFIIRSCEYLTLEGFGELVPQNSDIEIDRQTPRGFTITNRANVEFDISLVGPVTYLKKLSIGLNRYEIVPGDYTYICSVNGRRYQGTISVPESGYGHLAVPPLTEKKQLENSLY